MLAKGSLKSGREYENPFAPCRSESPLQVYFHGLFAFVVRHDCIEAIAPPMDEHVYKAGTVFSEKRLSENTSYRLKGVSNPTSVPEPGSLFPPTSYIVLPSRRTDIIREPSTMYCSITVPIPDYVEPRRKLCLDPRKIFCGNDSASIQCQETSIVQVFHYSTVQSASVSLDPGPVWSPPSSQGPIKLLIFAEPDITVQDTHPSKAFDQYSELFSTLDLHICDQAKFNMPENPTCQEEYSLIERWLLWPVLIPVPVPAEPYILERFWEKQREHVLNVNPNHCVPVIVDNAR